MKNNYAISLKTWHIRANLKLISNFVLFIFFVFLVPIFCLKHTIFLKL